MKSVCSPRRNPRSTWRRKPILPRLSKIRRSDFDYTFAKLPADLAKQRAAALAGHGNDRDHDGSSDRSGLGARHDRRPAGADSRRGCRSRWRRVPGNRRAPKRFGPERVLDTPLAEAGIVGLSVGLAAQGFRPVAEIQFTGFIYPAIDQLANHASRLRTRTRGRLTCPLVVRSPCGGGIHAVEHHSESPEAMFAGIPGLRTVLPSSPRRAYGLLLAAICDPDPVVFLEPTRLYRAAKENVADDGKALPLDRCFVLREGQGPHDRHVGRNGSRIRSRRPRLSTNAASAPRSSTWRR